MLRQRCIKIRLSFIRIPSTKDASIKQEKPTRKLVGFLFAEIDGFVVDGLGHGPIYQEVFLAKVNIWKIVRLYFFWSDADSVFFGVFDTVEDG